MLQWDDPQFKRDVESISILLYSFRNCIKLPRILLIIKRIDSEPYRLALEFTQEPINMMLLCKKKST